jgi:hypothetical protein
MRVLAEVGRSSPTLGNGTPSRDQPVGHESPTNGAFDMDRQTASGHDEALRVSAAAIAAQHAAVTEREIRLGEARAQFVAEQRHLLADVEAILLNLLAQEEHLERRQAEVRSRETFATRLENACTRLARELEVVRCSLDAEGNVAMPRVRAA